MRSDLRLSAATLLPGIVAAALLAAPARADVVTDWNVITNDLVANDVGNNPKLRTLAMVHVAMSDAINTVQNRYTRVVATLPAAPSASAEAAAAAAAQQILTQVYPQQKSKIEEGYAASLKAIPEGPAKTEGIKLGMEVAAAVQADRANDGTNAPDAYRPHAAPGAYVPTSLPAWEQYARAKPWVLNGADQFRPGPPPTLSSAEWARDYNEVKSLGGTKSTARTPEQTEAVTFWGNVNFGPALQAAARELAKTKEMPLAECARLFALLNMGLANAYVLNWEAKYYYNFWRPVTAIRNGDQDGNDATERDAGWTSFNPTPMHPEYPSQATYNATTAVAVLESVFGPVKAIPFTATDVRDPKRTRQFASLADMAEEQKNVRVWGGVHYRFAIRASEDVAPKATAYLIENTLKPAR
ncbi:vanadium-dependent haloperoxidase [Bradyrhizobium sp. JYMT SZCCT0180]|uniref:vanadium-dependent haloperoxidase n=1 Tax=Bradyrhizobium sp. JYMT SZCCT0180 TaxID=2807666 RepID=UPI001BA527CA|nr:vanadium-dependent haloperoxidase [Bradyrhizobium sp. JYMT SZCCT0180]MBR1215580.1 vanadium-dependent haloperoxidase [Bradyrhizobium sp. JYMT SZCCT0180]